jgi:catechol 2,3-dioxygenase-like lactoylglutathione lyase family enzyme/D-Tyr-tRNAtyr deacylase
MEPPPPPPHPFGQQVTFLNTSSLEATADFYGGTLGLPLVYEVPGFVLFYRCASDSFLGICLRAERTAGDTAGAIPTLVVGTTQEVDAWQARLEAAGVELEKRAGPGVSSDGKSIPSIYNLFIRDPAGYLVEIQVFLDEAWPRPPPAAPFAALAALKPEPPGEARTAAPSAAPAAATTAAAAAADPPPPSPVNAGAEGCVNIVVQRVEEASLLVDNADAWVSINAGLLVYVSFAQGASSDGVARAAKALLSLPLCTPSGQWGDGSSVDSYLRICRQQAEASTPLLELLVVPQAALSGRVGRKHRGLTYVDQVEKETGRGLYDEFVAALRGTVSELTAPALSGAELAAEYSAQFQAKQAAAKAAALQPPELLFRTAEYSAWDGRGMPTHDAAGEEVSKNAKKKLEKRMKVATAKYLKAAAAPAPTAAPPTAAAVENKQEKGKEDVKGRRAAPCTNDDGSVVKCGTFGNRQGLRISATGGPFCHTLTL